MYIYIYIHILLIIYGTWRVRTPSVRQQLAVAHLQIGISGPGSPRLRWNPFDVKGKSQMSGEIWEKNSGWTLRFPGKILDFPGKNRWGPPTPSREAHPTLQEAWSSQKMPRGFTWWNLVKHVHPNQGIGSRHQNGLGWFLCWGFLQSSWFDAGQIQHSCRSPQWLLETKICFRKSLELCMYPWAIDLLDSLWDNLDGQTN